MTLNALAPGQRATIRHLGEMAGNDSLCRMAELGFTEGTSITLVRRAPFGDPLVVRILGYELCIRASEAACIQVEASPAGSTSP